MQVAARSHLHAGQHGVILLDPHLTAKACLLKLRLVVGIGLVRRHVERCFDIAGIDADRQQVFRRQCMIEPDRLWAGLEHDALRIRRTLAEHISQQFRIRPAYAAPICSP
jgi:hypothetical protein